MTRRERMAVGHPGHVIGYAAEHDRHACATCDVWVEPQCRCAGDRCESFPDSPERPSQSVVELIYVADVAP